MKDIQMNDATYNLLACWLGFIMISWAIAVLAESSGWMYIALLMIGTVVVTIAFRNTLDKEN